jgi:hypothetical protein
MSEREEEREACARLAENHQPPELDPKVDEILMVERYGAMAVIRATAQATAITIARSIRNREAPYRKPAGFDVGHGFVREGDPCIVTADGNQPDGPGRVITVYHDGRATIELRRVVEVRWERVRPLLPREVGSD